MEAKVSEHGRSSRWWLSPGWLFVHLFTLALVIAMVLLGRWQLIVSDRKHFNLQNFGYAIQWWMFSIFVVGFWVRVLRDAGRRRATGGAPAQPAQEAHEPVAYRRYVMPQSKDGPPAGLDPEQTAYNEYLARLAESARPDGEGTRR